MANEPVRVYSLALLAAEPLNWDTAALADRLQAQGSSAELSPLSTPGSLLHVTHAGGPSGAVVLAGDAIDRAFTDKALRQTWDWPGASAALAQCRQAFFVSDRAARHLPYPIRLRRLQRIVGALLETAAPQGACLALHVPLCQLLVEPSAFLEGQQTGTDFLCGAVNVRLFHVEEQRPGDLLMDTLGLAALGLPDLQCHFNGAEPNDMARLLWDCAYYLFEKGDAIADGHAVAGLRPEQRWLCRHERSLTEPERVVLDVNPGPEYAAAGR